MEVSITSMETVRPFRAEVDVLKPFKLSFIDQIIPPHYVPLIFFYTQSNNPHLNSAQISSPLRQSLSKALNVFYPLSGRFVDNSCIDKFKEGVPYFEAKVNGRASDYLQPLKLDQMNDLFPYQVFEFQPNPESLPLVAVQVNVFDCGGIALSLCCSHTIFDASTIFAFLTSWAAFCRGCNGEIPQPDLLGAASRLYPPLDSMPPEILSMAKSSLFKEGKYKTKAFAFDANAIDTLILKTKSETLQRPSKYEALGAFIWKHVMLACRSASGIVKPSILSQAVHLRHRAEPQLPDYAIGNLYNVNYVTYESNEKDIELHDLALRLSKSLKNFNMEEGQDVEIPTEGSVESILFSNWLDFGMHQIDFGWGKPTWYGLPGIVAPAFTNNVLLREIGEDKAVETWITLDEKIMSMLEHDPEFLQFATPNPHYH